VRMPRLDLLTRTELFALAVFHFCRALPKTKEAQEPADQLRRAANGIRTNYRAARRGRSYAEFKAKLGVVFEEADEAADWLRYFRDTGMRHDPALVREGEELARIFAASVATARKNSRRWKDHPNS
jgi:four helix bundle protein